MAVAVAFLEDPGEAFDRIGAALNLLCFYGKRTLADLRNHTEGIWVSSTHGGLAEWRRDLRVVVLDETYVRDAENSPRHLASTLVHEATHARLERKGFQYTLERRGEIERACFRRQLAFARRLPDAEDLITEARMQLARPPDWLTPEAFQMRKHRKDREHLGQLHELGFPRLLLKMLERRIERRYKATSAK